MITLWHDSLQESNSVVQRGAFAIVVNPPERKVAKRTSVHFEQSSRAVKLYFPLFGALCITMVEYGSEY